MTAVDLRPDLGPIRDQGPRGTCLAFAATAAHEQARRNRRGDLPDDLGEEVLYWACKQVDGNRTAGTSGASAAQALATTGQSASALWPYDGGRDDTDASYAPPGPALEPDAMRHATLRDAAPDLDEIRNELQRQHVVVIGFELWQGFYEAHGGALGTPAAGELLGDLHAVAAVGFDDDAHELLVRNSWGDTWGDGGYGRLPYPALAIVCRGVWTIEDDIDA